ncbi:4-(cytidine 5'-diphospho)-2-C-methyl-D-erythritol kinase [Tabrizicola fusiformis]|uniref:4-(cytidine 5'-diphospho)-2-C-methyl-D-erythritol kinase n=1 Tax=Tabrizicola sp. SY72 TaxID=2741673 RepID=UPI001571E26D|nr:4-(cytidine 5'-diphospho)-2-C-methyl-D-erythritol kinase [Tabrizicola sp. SY72]NTT84656.1 4-(cytidine 5'-diphospho)-2-C-methyl-D-erythritol kinase [Tabrizicola sp. SY72]
MTTETALARAKVNLALHVVGRRADGYHLLDSLVVFAEFGDRITVAPGQGLRLTVTGPQGGGLAADDDNLCLRAARAMAGPGAQITLEKHLPVASGIGGGSADAAATLQALARLWRVPLPDAAAVLALGADVPVCLAGRPARMEGVGEVLSLLPPLPAAWLVLVNPGVAVSTPAVFRALERRDNARLPATLPRLATAEELAAFLMMQRNDLEAPAMALAPVIGQVRSALSAQSGCLMARMSGSGATCFGLFPDALNAAAAAAALRRVQPGWWVEAAELAR